MAHVRAQVRNAVKARLEDSDAFATVCGELRFQREFQDDEFPAAAVSVTETDEPVGRGLPGQRPLKRRMGVTVMVALRLDDADEDALDALTVAVEKALADPKALGIGGLLDWGVSGTGAIQSQFAAFGLAAVPVDFGCTITTREDAPETNIHA